MRHDLPQPAAATRALSEILHTLARLADGIEAGTACPLEAQATLTRIVGCEGRHAALDPGLPEILHVAREISTEMAYGLHENVAGGLRVVAHLAGSLTVPA